MILYIEVEVERTEGKFVSKDELAEALCDDIENGGSISVDDSTYEILAVSQGQSADEIKNGLIRPELDRLIRRQKRQTYRKTAKV